MDFNIVSKWIVTVRLFDSVCMFKGSALSYNLDVFGAKVN